jgi:AraC-like DNA-binding protein
VSQAGHEPCCGIVPVSFRPLPVKRRQRIPDVSYVAPTALGVEVMTFGRLREKATRAYLTLPSRPGFHLILLGRSGEGVHTVDFRGQPVGAGRSAWVRPGQVQVFADLDRVAGDLVLFRPDFLVPGTLAARIADDHLGASGFAHAGAALAELEAARRALRREYAEATGPGYLEGPRPEILRHLLSILVLRLTLAPSDSSGAAPRPSVYRDFRDLLERDFAVAHDTAHYAGALGYSTRTLARVTERATGRTPKQEIGERLSLEARRLLAHSDLEVAAISRRLGFSDPSNFSAFFVRRTGRTPTSFREEQRGNPRARASMARPNFAPRD